MTPLKIHLDGDGCWPDLAETSFTVGRWVALARIPGGTSSGRSAVAARIELPDGRVVLAQTTLRLLVNAVRTFEIAEEESSV